MGTILDVTVVAARAEDARALANAAVDEARRWDGVLTTWRADGELARLNDRAGQGAVSVSSELAGALRTMLALRAATGGAFDPLLGSRVRAWRAPGGDKAAALLLPPVSGEALRIGERSATLAPQIEIDAGGIGKGVALDAIVRRLRVGGAAAAFLNFGGSSQTAFGNPPDEPRGWPVMVAAAADGVAHGIVWLKDASLSTSRASGPGDEAGPIVDPVLGQPVPGPRVATVLARDATSADAWSTALVVLGRKGLDRAQAQGIAALVDDGAAVATTPAFPLVPGPSADGSAPPAIR
ncbi:FAD:protein FMN transferase [Candidatus Binatia bacterium]|nr:FAD:protein FMN transferase [Candidatus Binatia bacterium]